MGAVTHCVVKNGTVISAGTKEDMRQLAKDLNERYHTDAYRVREWGMTPMGLAA